MVPLMERYRESRPVEQRVELGVGLVNLLTARFDTIYKMLAQYPHWDATPTSTHHHLYRYTSQNDMLVCTDVHIASGVTIRHVTKKELNSLELHMRGHGKARVSLVCATRVDEELIPQTVVPSSVSLKTQYTFTKGAWVFVLSRTWTGDTRTDVELAQSKGEPLYGVEVRFVPGAAYWEDARHTSTYAATSMLMKLVDVVSPEMVDVDVLDAP
jgi:hypothetical protein